MDPIEKGAREIVELVMSQGDCFDFATHGRNVQHIILSCSLDYLDQYRDILEGQGHYVGLARLLERMSFDGLKPDMDLNDREKSLVGHCVRRAKTIIRRIMRAIERDIEYGRHL